MPNEEHLKILKQGVKVWNKWRRENPYAKPDLSYAQLSGLQLEGVSFPHTLLTGSILNECQLQRANLTGALLSEAQLRKAELSQAILHEAKLGHADLSYATLGRAVLMDADLRNSFLTEADLHDAELGGALLRRTDLAAANFREVLLSQTLFMDVDLTTTKGLETCQHVGHSVIDHLTLQKSKGLPSRFLSGCGLPDSLIDWYNLAREESTIFYSCFISYTDADDELSLKLLNDLRNKGVNSWRWRENAKTGRTLMHSVDDAIREQDKVIVICSEQSLQSPPVLREIERALQKEDELQLAGKESEVLVPIKIDDYIFDSWDHYRKADVIVKKVGDFRGWKDPEKYQKAFDGLLKGLGAN